MFNGAFNQLTDNDLDFYPCQLRQEIDQVNDLIYRNVNNGVYRVWFATSQGAYDEAVKKLFSTLDYLEHHLAQNDYLVGGVLTEADWRLFVTVVRFELVYVGHFKCNLRRIADYPNLYAYIGKLYHHEGIAKTVHLSEIKTHYYASHKAINPTGIVPIGSQITL